MSKILAIGDLTQESVGR